MRRVQKIGYAGWGEGVLLAVVGESLCHAPAASCCGVLCVRPYPAAIRCASPAYVCRDQPHLQRFSSTQSAASCHALQFPGHVPMEQLLSCAGKRLMGTAVAPSDQSSTAAAAGRVQSSTTYATVAVVAAEMEGLEDTS